jgi:mRNA interferase MazF
VVTAGDVVFLDLDPIEGNEQAGTRPCLVLSENVHPTLSIIVPLTKTPPRNPRLHIELDTLSPKKKRSTALCDHVRSLDVMLRLDRRKAGWRVSYDDLDTVRRAVARAIGIY